MRESDRIAAERHDRMLQCKRAGYTYRQLVAEFGGSIHTVRDKLKRALAREERQKDRFGSLSIKARNVLRNAGLYEQSWQHIAAGMTEWKRIKNCGAHTHKEIMDWLSAQAELPQTFKDAW